MLPVEVFATTINFFDWQKVWLIAWLFPSEALDCLIFKGQRSNWSPASWLLPVWRSPLISPPKEPPKRAPQKELWSHNYDSNFDPDRKHFYTGHISDYPLDYSSCIHTSTAYSTCKTIVHTGNEHKAMVAKMAQDVGVFTVSCLVVYSKPNC